jgi:hypothetical protein
VNHLQIHFRFDSKIMCLFMFLWKLLPLKKSLKTRIVTRLTRRAPLVAQELLTLPEHLSSPPIFSEVCVTRSLVLCYSIFDLMCMFCRSLFVLLIFLFWPLCSMFFFDIRIMITPLVSSNFS